MATFKRTGNLKCSMDATCVFPISFNAAHGTWEAEQYHIKLPDPTYCVLFREADLASGIAGTNASWTEGFNSKHGLSYRAMWIG